MWIKICGLKTASEARQISELKPDAIGLNFYSGSKRGISPETAREICREIPDSVSKVGVFVDQTPSEILEIAESVGLDYVQLHGDYRPVEIRQLKRHPFIWVHRLKQGGMRLLEQELAEIAQAGSAPFACLVDACVEGQYGGSGQTVDWDQLANSYDSENWPALILAGGLVPENVSEAIRIVSPFGVDVASGVETNVSKDLEKCRQFISQARQNVES